MASVAAANSSAPFDSPQLDGAYIIPADKAKPIQRSIARSRSADGRSNSTGHNSEHANSRLEELLVQQNLLMSRHLELVEENNRRVASMESISKKPQEILARVDPMVKRILNEWRSEFREKVAVYIAQSRTCSKYDEAGTNGALVAPFVNDARKSWQWPQYYRAVAKPVLDVDPVFSDGTAAGLIEDKSQTEDVQEDHWEKSQEQPNCYSIDAAFAELRHRHAQELQNFVIAHQKACLEVVREELTLSHQMMVVQKKLSTQKLEQPHFHNVQVPEAKQKEIEAMKFVEMVFLAEMAKAEKKIGENHYPASAFALRLVCIMVVLLSLTRLDGERLTQLFAVLFAIFSGMALLWEDAVLSNLHHVFGGALGRFQIPSSWQPNLHFAIQW